MLPTLTVTPETHRRIERRKIPFRYCAAMTGTGEIRQIQEFLGRRFVRHLDPFGRIGRDLLVRGQVALWCRSVVEGKRLPVGTLLEKLHAQAVDELNDGTGIGWERSCRQRIETIESWQSFFGTDSTGI